jgi:lipopolysaccharide transport system permease protein
MSDADRTAPSLPSIVIRPARGWRSLQLAELLRYRELIYFLAWRDVKVRYKQTLLGAAWAVLQPALLMIVFTLFLRGAGLSSGDVPYPLFVYCGLLPWTFFSAAVAGAAQSVLASERLVTRVYFPRLAIPLASVAAAVVDFVIAFALLIGLLLYYGVVPGGRIVWLPVIALAIVLAAVGFGTLLAALNVAYRDVRYIVTFLLQLWLFATPAIYTATLGRGDRNPASADAAENPARTAVSPEASGHTGPPGGVVLNVINPLNGLIWAFRAAALNEPLPASRLVLPAGTVLGVFLAGCYYFRRVEDSFADII